MEENMFLYDLDKRKNYFILFFHRRDYFLHSFVCQPSGDTFISSFHSFLVGNPVMLKASELYFFNLHKSACDHLWQFSVLSS